MLGQTKLDETTVDTLSVFELYVADDQTRANPMIAARSPVDVLENGLDDHVRSSGC